MKKLYKCSIIILLCLYGCSSKSNDPNASNNTNTNTNDSSSINSTSDYKLKSVSNKRLIYINEKFSSTPNTNININNIEISIVEKNKNIYTLKVYNNSNSLFRGNIMFEKANKSVSIEGLIPYQLEYLDIDLGTIDYIDDHSLKGMFYDVLPSYKYVCDIDYGYHDNSKNLQLMNAYIENYSELTLDARYEIATYFLKLDIMDNVLYDTTYYIMDSSMLNKTIEERVVLFKIHVYPNLGKVEVFDVNDKLEHTIEL
ncbi:MAG: hypothetical protein RR646_07600 [Erysipelotrichaceae bacterium]